LYIVLFPTQNKNKQQKRNDFFVVSFESISKIYLDCFFFHDYFHENLNKNNFDRWSFAIYLSINQPTLRPLSLPLSLILLRLKYDPIDEEKKREKQKITDRKRSLKCLRVCSYLFFFSSNQFLW